MQEQTGEYALTTYRYLRVTVVGLVFLLGTAVIIQLVRESGNPRPSISDYYYSPARAVFVSTLVAVGVCMIVLKGRSWEDTFLNLAGGLAPVVAFVPTEAQGTCEGGRGVSAATAANISNNVLALLIAGLGGLLAAAYLARKPGTSLALRRPAGGGLALATLLWAAAAGWFTFGRSSFECGAHNVAAITMFAFIVAVVAWNAWGAAGRSVTAAPRTSYGALAITMLVTAGVLGVATAAGLPSGIFWLESSLIVLFAVFWVIQTPQRWDGLRSEP